MGYHDLEPEAFLFSVAVQQTNSAEEAALFDKWLKETTEKAKRLAPGMKEKQDVDRLYLNRAN